ncbi:hypothetical protein [Cupriavidus basilensis]|uniref:hypothetical protein n=1 Tax=Cupriavidus basilensis TaxID=68895 RepID=UPI0020A6739E|nr:hypothetical protein [Cupriavidus basilensis]MCP3024969.1 hypothetical protein [Cupriavidus basilensis]
MSAKMSPLESLIHDVAIAAKAQFKAAHSSYTAGRAVVIHIIKNEKQDEVITRTEAAIKEMREQIADPKVWQATVSKSASAYRRIAEAFALGLITADKASITGKTDAENLKDAIALAKAPKVKADEVNNQGDASAQGDATKQGDTATAQAIAMPTPQALQALADAVSQGATFDADTTRAILALVNAVTLRAEATRTGRIVGAEVAATIAA